MLFGIKCKKKMLAKSNNARKSASTMGKSLVSKGLKAIEQNNLIGYNQCWLWLRFSHFDLLRWFLRRKKKDIWPSFLKFSLPMSVLKNTVKKDSSLCLFKKMTGQTYPTYASTSNFSQASFHGTFFGSWKQGFSK